MTSAGHYVSCDVHGKLLHLTRKAAKRAARLHGDRMSVYRCDQFDGYHCGHLPAAVKEGRLLRLMIRRTR